MNEPELIAGLTQLDLFALFKQQVRKDFEDSGVDAEFTLNLPSDYWLLIECIAGQLVRIDKHGSGALMNLLYRIDINEKSLNKHLELNTDQNLYKAMAEQIIKRILQKVVLKKRFSK